MTVPSIPYKTAGNRIGVSLLDFAEGVPIEQGGVYCDDVIENAIAKCAEVFGGTHRARALIIPAGTYKTSRTINLNRQINIIGEGGLFANGWSPATTIVPDAGITAIRVHRANTSADGGSGEGSYIGNLAIQKAGASATGHGIQLWARAKIENVVIDACQDGIHIAADTSTGSVDPLTAWAPDTDYEVGEEVSNDGGKWYICKVAGESGSSGGPTGTSTTITSDGSVTWGYVSGTNANGWGVFNALIGAGRHGIYTIGGDANAGTAMMVDINGCGGKGIYDSSFLGNTYIGCQVAAATEAPYKSDNPNARNAFFGCYCEGGQPPAEIDRPAIVLGGTWGTAVGGGSTLAGTGWFLADGFRASSTSYAAGGVADVLTIGGEQILAIAGQLNAFRLAQVSYIGKVRTWSANTAVSLGWYVYTGGKRWKCTVAGTTGSSAPTGVGTFVDGTATWTYQDTSPTTAPTGLSGVERYNWANAAGWEAWGFANDDRAAFQTGSESPRFLPAGQFFTGMNWGALIDGRAIFFSDTNDLVGLGFGRGIQMHPGDLIFKRTPAAGQSPGWVVTARGNTGSYATEALTCTSTGVKELTLSGNTHPQHGLQVGDRILIDGVTDVVITGRGEPSGTAGTNYITVDTNVPAGSGLSIEWVDPTFVALPALPGGGADSTGSPGAATQNTRKGRAAIAIGAAAVTITNSLVTATSIVGVALQSNDATLTQILRVVPASGSFTITGNANATAATNVAWWLIE